MRRSLILSGGVGHRFEVTSGQVAELLCEAGFESHVEDDLEAGMRAAAEGWDLVVVNALRWRMLGERYAHMRDEYQFSPSASARRAVERHLEQGGALLALHTASICFDDWPEWRRIVGGAWNWERSCHPPLGPAHVTVNGAHPIIDGLDDFDIVDEIYGFLDLEPDVVPLLHSSHGGAAHPVLWTHEYRGGRVVYDALGHDERSYIHPAQRAIIPAAARWLVGAPRA